MSTREPLPLVVLGHQVRVVPNETMPPVLQISPDFPYCSPEFRASWDKWALERFGRQNRILFMQMGNTKLACMTDEMALQLRAEVERLPVFNAAAVRCGVTLRQALARTGPLGAAIVRLDNGT